MNTLTFYYLEFEDGSFCDVQTYATLYEPLCVHGLNLGLGVEVVTSHSPWRTEQQFIDKKVASVVKLPDGYRDQFIYE